MMASTTQLVLLLVLATAKPSTAKTIAAPSPKIVVTLSDMQTTIVMALGCLTFLILILGLVDQLMFARDYRLRHGLLMERMTNILVARLPVTPNTIPIPPTYISANSKPDCAIAKPAKLA